MSAKAHDVVALGLVASSGVDDHALLCDAIEAFYAAVGQVPWMITRNAPKAISRAYSSTRLRSVVSDPIVNEISIWAKAGSNCPRFVLHLRDRPSVDDYQRRWSAVVAHTDVGLEAIKRMAATLSDRFTLLCASIATYRDRSYAEQECVGRGVAGEVDKLTDARLTEDSMLDHRTRTKLRRLYPITIIGPTIWATLPPMPAFDPMPTVEDFGYCKLLTAWPTLCEPRDPAFLHGTRALREWLWPYTIQNPADHIDNDPPPPG